MLIRVGHEVGDEGGGSKLVFAKLRGSLASPLGGDGHGASGCKISRRATTHSVCHDPDAVIIQESQGILVRRSDMTGFSSADSGPWLGLHHGATLIGSCCLAGGNPMEEGPNRATIWS